MDKIGVEKLSCNENKNGTSAIFDSTNTSENVAKNVNNCVVGKGPSEIYSSQEGDGSKECGQDSFAVASNITERVVCDGAAAIEDDLDEKEKADATPENLKKIDDVICANYGHENMQTGEELRIVEDESPSKQSLAFTIDFSGGEPATSTVAAAKYKNIMERFQNRHKRGASMSKLEDQGTPTASVTSKNPRATSAQVRQARCENSEAGKVKLRIRERSTSGARDSSKRHSWSPRSSTHENLEAAKFEKQSKLSVRNVNKCSPVISKPARPAVKSVSKVTVESTTSVQLIHNNRMQYPKNEANSSFTPRSTAMQMALSKFEFVCPEPPLEQKKIHDDGDSVSEAGTYTLDGDNYTEEQKELMNIDKSTRRRLELQNPTNILKDLVQMRPNDLPLLSSTSEGQRKNNVLEISYYHDSTNLKPKVSYLEKIKSRVRNITKSPDKKIGTSADVGQFTSVTTSGILSKKGTLDTHPRLTRRNSLTKSHIDSSEYVSTDSSLRSQGIVCPSTFTDHQKAEYKLNLFTNQGEYTVESSSTPDSPNDGYSKIKKCETGLKTAQSKSDWIQEWAKNARARSMSVTKDLNNQMSRSYDCETTDNIFTDSGYRNKHIDKFRSSRMGDMEYSSDTNVAARKTTSAETIVNSRPPLSPSRIPSPLHTVGRVRGIGRIRGSLQDLSPMNSGAPETDVYLQKTAAAISNLAQSLSRKNSLQSCKSPPSASDSPRRLYSQHYSADEYSPPNTGRNGIHKRNLSLDYRTNVMSQSLNNETLAGLIDYRNRQRARQNSFDAVVDSPSRRSRQAFIDQTQSSIKQPSTQSPLKRSSSFSVKPLSSNSLHKAMPASRNVQKNVPRTTTSTGIKNPIQKSASSTSFRKMYSDYDENIAYYINDEDDLIDDYCSSEEYEDREFYQEAEIEPLTEPEPITNTRYNKALLMRIERSKQKVAGMTQAKPNSAGVVACPNTPEMPRRAVQSATRSSMRQSVPRDSSLNRLRGEVPSSLASAKKQLLQTAVTVSSGKKVQPKYLDISKYKSAQGGNFLKKDESKSTLVNKVEVKRSPSSASVLSRNDPTRASNRSVQSAGSRSAKARRDASVAKQKEAELAMWKRRATYDPMKAAAEGRKKQEEAKKIGQTQPKQMDSSVVLRSQSFHSGVGTLSGNRAILQSGGGRLGGSTATDGSDQSYRWTLTSTESSDEEEEGVFATNNS